MDNNEKLNLDDITFDDFIDGGVELGGEEAVAAELGAVEDPKPDTPAVGKETDIVEPGKEIESIDADEPIAADTKIKPEAPEVDAPNEIDDDAGADDAETAVVSEVLTNLGYELEGDYDDTVDGLTKLTKDVAGTMAEEQLDSLFEKFPEIQQHLEYVLNGGRSGDFYNQGNRLNSVSNINLSEDNVNMQRAVLVEYFRAKGHEDSFIQEMIDDYSTADKLYDKSVKAQDALIKYEEANKSKLIAEQKQNHAKQKKEAQEFWNGVSDTVQNAREFSGIVVQEKDKKKFFDYISKPVNKQGNTQRDIDHGGAEMDVKLAIDYLMFKGFKLDDMIKAKAKTEAAKTLRTQIKSGKAKSVKGAKGKSKSMATDLDSLDLSFSSL